MGQLMICMEKNSSSLMLKPQTKKEAEKRMRAGKKTDPTQKIYTSIACQFSEDGLDVHRIDTATGSGKACFPRQGGGGQARPGPVHRFGLFSNCA